MSPNVERPFATASFTLNEVYYRESYSQWLHHVSRYRHFMAPLGWTCVVMAIMAAIMGPRPEIIATTFLFCGAVVHCDNYVARKRWFSDRRKSKTFNGAAHIAFCDDAIWLRFPFSEGTWVWEGVEPIRQTRLGLFISPQKGAALYVPISKIEPRAAVSMIVTKCR